MKEIIKMKAKLEKGSAESAADTNNKTKNATRRYRGGGLSPKFPSSLSKFPSSVSP